MDDDELANILDIALEQGRFERDDLYLFDTKLAWQLTNEAHVRDPQRTMVFEALEAHPDIVPLLGKVLNCGLNAPQLSVTALGDWILTQASRIGAKRTVTELRTFINSPHCDIEEYLAFSGLEVDTAIALSPEVDLLPMSSLPESALSISLTDPEWFYYGRSASGHVRRKTVQTLAGFGKSTWHTNPHIATAALKVHRKSFPKVLPASAEIASSAETMLDTLLVLAAVTCTAMFPVAHWISPTPTTPLWGNFAWSNWSHLMAIRTFATTDGNEANIIAAVRAWEAFPTQSKIRLKVPLERLNRGLAAPLSVDCAIDIGVSLEALLLGDLAPNDQISLSFRLRGAWLLGTSPLERKELARYFSAIYACRSAAVHSGKLPTDSFLVNSSKVSADKFMMKHAQYLAAKAILEVIGRGAIPDWSALVLGVGG